MADRNQHQSRTRRESGRASRARQMTQRDLQSREQARERAAAYRSESNRYRSRSSARSGSRERSLDRGTRTKARKKNGSLIPKIAACVVALAVVVGAAWAVDPLNLHDGGVDMQGAAVSHDGTNIVDAGNTAAVVQSEHEDELPTPIMAQSSGLDMHCAVAMSDLTEVLIHNASYSYANEITTQLAEATNEQVMKKHGTGRDKSAQLTGDKWMTGEFIRTFRSNNAGPRMSAIDCGAQAGSQVYAPVSGKVVLVKKYKLYDQFEDYRVHIQPEGREDLDVVLIHLTDVSVKAGDEVEAGVTPLARVRDVYALIGEQMQLKDYTAKNDDGNHTHIQVNNAKSKKYHGLDDLKKSEKNSG